MDPFSQVGVPNMTGLFRASQKGDLGTLVYKRVLVPTLTKNPVGKNTEHDMETGVM